MNIDKILLATDGSEESEKALEYSLYLAGVFGSKVVALYVSEIHFPLTSLFPIYEDVVMEIAEKTEKRFVESFIDLSGRFKERDIPFSTKIVRDGTVEGIIKTAEEESAGLIVMGKRGQGFILNTLIGSNTCKVIRDTVVPVLAVRSRDRGDRVEIKKILVPIDISDAHVSALPEVLSLAGRIGAEVLGVYVFWLDGNVYDIPPGLVDELIKSSQVKLTQIVDASVSEINQSRSDKTVIQIKSEVLHGMSPAATIRDYAEENSADLIVIKTHGREGLNRLLYGSDTERIIQESPCSVLAIK